MTDNNNERKNELLVLHLAAGKTVTEAAAASGMSERTAFRRLRKPAFQLRLLSAFANNVKPSVDRLRSQFDASVDALVAIRDDPNTPPAIRLRAATEILTHIERFNLRVVDNVRLEALMRAVENLEGNDDEDAEDDEAPANRLGSEALGASRTAGTD